MVTAAHEADDNDAGEDAALVNLMLELGLHVSQNESCTAHVSVSSTYTHSAPTMSSRAGESAHRVRSFGPRRMAEQLRRADEAEPITLCGNCGGPTRCPNCGGSVPLPPTRPATPCDEGPPNTPTDTQPVPSAERPPLVYTRGAESAPQFRDGVRHGEVLRERPITPPIAAAMPPSMPPRPSGLTRLRPPTPMLRMPQSPRNKYMKLTSPASEVRAVNQPSPPASPSSKGKQAWRADSSSGSQQFRYVVESGTRTGLMEHWVDTAYATQGIPDSSQHALSTRNQAGLAGQCAGPAAEVPAKSGRARGGSRKHCKVYAVTIGSRPGVFTSWNECAASIVGFSGAAWKGYPELQLARAVFERAQARGAVYDVPLERIREVLVERAVHDFGSRVHPFSTGSVPVGDAHCIVVFRGLDVGVFADWLDCAELVLCVPCAVFNGFVSMEDGLAAFERAKQLGFIRVFESRSLDTLPPIS
ncbi:hypothetical protein CERSUDRAFT_98554 [Gelatoporia subvermispora B]|uniref:Ribonuclease H1 N-terminal domain-containing protein n=1 Tax=Ceriporiopsis subvermispora (strain B) TaxID=914234 RepID=M2R3H2_CERS8|nr:hypothetical protein CERSUDRAFT_98554 [Gelatoporia subvermispora B]